MCVADGGRYKKDWSMIVDLRQKEKVNISPLTQVGS